MAWNSFLFWRNVGWHLDHYGTVRLDWRVADDLAHAVRLADTKCRVVDIEQVVVRLRNCFDDTQKTRGTIGCERLQRIGQRIDVCNRRAVEDIEKVYFERIKVEPSFEIEC